MLSIIIIIRINFKMFIKNILYLLNDENFNYFRSLNFELQQNYKITLVEN